MVTTRVVLAVAVGNRPMRRALGMPLDLLLMRRTPPHPQQQQPPLTVVKVAEVAGVASTLSRREEIAF